MDKYKRIIVSLRKKMRPIKRQVALMKLPSFLRVDATGDIRPEDQEAFEQAKALGVTMKEYIVDDEWSPDMDGIDP